MRILLVITIAIFVLLTNNSCEKDPTSITESFDSLSRPSFEYNEKDDYYLLKPWNYNEEYNANRSYPLVIFLHGSGGAGNISYLGHIGYDDPNDTRINEKAWNFQQDHPCFTLVPQTQGGWSNGALIELTENIKSNFRIDESRIYLIGYSMGGSGSYSFANSYYDHNEHLFAGIIRLAGQSQTSVRDAIAEKTGIWLHIGLNDTEKRVQVTREAFQFFRDFYSTATESESKVPIADHDGTTKTLFISGSARFKITEYNGVGHGVATLPFKDPGLIEWLFSQHL